MNPFRMAIWLVLIAGIFIGVTGKFIFVTGYDFGFKYTQKKGFFVMPFFVNLEAVIGDPQYLKYDDVENYRLSNPQAAESLADFLNAIDNYLICDSEQAYLEECTNYFLNENVYNTVTVGPIDWQKLYPYTDYTERQCPSGGSFYHYRIGSSFRIGCSHHTRQVDNEYHPYIGL